jgi:hypothetical protein
MEVAGPRETPHAYMSENKAPAAQLSLAGALRLFPPLTAASVPLTVFSLELNGPDVARPHPWLAQLIRGRAEGVVARIDRRTTRQQGEMPGPRRAVIGEVA